jgi:2-oxoglutarate/2-oxoacid ferredoxin oxidoreductase subunit alpha
MPRTDLTFAMVGAGGDGVVTMGDMLSQAAARIGLHAMKTEAYGPQIRGGEASCTVRISSEPILAPGDTVDVLVLFSLADFARFKGEVLPARDAFVVYEAADPLPIGGAGLELGEEATLVAVPFAELARQSAMTPSAKNVVALGLVAELFGLPVDGIRLAVEAKFGRKKAGVREANLKAFELGIAHARVLAPDVNGRRLSYVPGEKRLLMSGNEATALGALHAGCRFFAGYPITPSTEVLQLLAEWMPEVGGSVVQTEDELSAIGAVVGASYAGVKSMTATSGPGLSLMTEMLGLSSIAEIPSVIVNVQRGGPSTGIPTKSEQSDLAQAVYASHGDAPRVVLACSDVEDSFHVTVDAFNIAEEYQIPVIVLSDQSIAQRKETLSIDALAHDVRERVEPTEESLAGGYERYAETPTGVSPMSRPGSKGGIYQTNGLEHDAHGAPSSMFLMHEQMNEKRYRKLLPIRDRYRLFQRFGSPRADVGILCWGSSKGVVKEAVLKANARGETVSAFVPQALYPFPKRDLEEFLASVRQLVIVELSYSAQFYRYLRTFLTLPEGRTRVFKRSGGKSLTAAEIDNEIAAALAAASAQNEEVLV